MLEELPLLVPAFADKLAPLEGLGYPAELEQVTLLNPDLILAPDDTIDVKQAGLIAPVIVPSPAIYDDWKIGMQFFTAVLNVRELYDEMAENYDARITELQEALGDSANDEISIISASTYGSSLWMPDSPPGSVVNDAGLSRPEAQRFVGDDSIAEYGERQYIEISDERMELADGDVIFYFTYAAVDPEVAKLESDFIKSFEQKPLWQSLDAGKEGKAYFVPGYWWRVQTDYLANQVVDDLFKYLTDTTATTPVIPIQ